MILNRVSLGAHLPNPPARRVASRGCRECLRSPAPPLHAYTAGSAIGSAIHSNTRGKQATANEHTLMHERHGPICTYNEAIQRDRTQHAREATPPGSRPHYEMLHPQTGWTDTKFGCKLGTLGALGTLQLSIALQSSNLKVTWYLAVIYYMCVICLNVPENTKFHVILM